MAYENTSASTLNILRTYQATFGHLPDNATLTHYVDEAAAGRTLGVIAGEMVTAGGLHNFAKEVLIVNLYASMFGRPPDKGGLAYWKASELSFGQIVASFAVSDEFTKQSGPAAVQAVYVYEHGGTLDPSTKLGGIPAYTLPDPVTNTVTVEVPVIVNVPTPTAEQHQVDASADATVSTLSQKIDGTMLFGSGNPSTHWGTLIDKTSNLELALNPVYRQSGEEIPITNLVVNGAHAEFDVVADAGTQDGGHGAPINLNRSAVSVNWAVSGGPGALGQDGTHQIVMDVEGGDHVVRSIKLTFGPGGEHVWRDASTDAPVIVDSPINAFSEQNSQNFAFAIFGAVADVQPGDYDVTLREVSLVGLDAGSTVASLTAHIHLV